MMIKLQSSPYLKHVHETEWWINGSQSMIKLMRDNIDIIDNQDSSYFTKSYNSSYMPEGIEVYLIV